MPRQDPDHSASNDQDRPTEDPDSAALEDPDPGLARDRTALAWTRSALNIAASGTLLARGAFTGHLDALGIAIAIATAAIFLLTWRQGQVIYVARRRYAGSPRLQTRAFGALTTATLAIAVAATVITVAI
jgi:hypothetical protein